jgi:hypothetical protein
MMLANIYDSSEANRLGKRFKPLHRPWPVKDREKLGHTDLSPDAARELLRQNRG